MAKMTWDTTGNRFFHTGVSDVALFMQTGNSASNDGYVTGVAWSGVTGVTQSPDGADAQNFYADNIKYLSLRAKENWKGTIKCYQYPTSFKAALGKKELVVGSGVYVGQQARKSFGLVWKTKYGNDTDGADHGYIIHIAYGLTAGPSEEEDNTENETPEINEFSFDLESTPASDPNSVVEPTSYVEFNSTDVNADKLTSLMNHIYGTDGTGALTPTMPTLANIRSWMT